MAHFAKIGLNGKVIGVHSVHNDVLKDADGVEQEVLGINFLTDLYGWSIWKQTSYNGNFIPPKLYASWVLNESTCEWEAPVALPSRDGLDITQVFIWNEETGSWDTTPNITP